MKTRGHILVKISSVLFILYGAASLLSVVLSFTSAEAAEEFGLADRLASPYPFLSVTFAVLVPLLFVAAGWLGMLRAERPNSMGLCFVLGIAIFVITAGDVLDLALSSLIVNVAEICTCILVLLIPSIYVIGAWRNWKQPKAPESPDAPEEK